MGCVVSLGRRGRCFFKAAGAGDDEEMEAGDGVLVELLLVVGATARPGAAVEARGAVMTGCKESF